MDKTIHAKLTEKHLYAQAATLGFAHGDNELLVGLKQEIKILHEAAKDLLQPRQQAVNNLLKMARSMQ